MNQVWFEDELVPSQEERESPVRGIGEKGITYKGLYDGVRGVVRAYEPDLKKLGASQPVTGREGTLWRVSLHFEFAPLSNHLRFVFALCEAYLEPLRRDEPQPRVYDFYPKHVREDFITPASLTFDPSVKVSGVEVSLGQISADMPLGRVAPVTTGFRGFEARNPHWRLRPTKHDLVGARDFYLAVEQPAKCRAVSLRIRAQGTIQSKWGPIAVRPTNYVWDSRPKTVIR